jgi:hypothetical protein
MMEKIVYSLWREPSVSREQFNANLLELAAQLKDNVHGLRVNIQDQQVAGGSAPIYKSSEPQMEAFVQVWVDTALDFKRKAIDEQIARVAPRQEAWLVSESVPIVNESPVVPGQRTEAYTHMAVISVPPRLTWQAWRDAWQTRHTIVAIETQSNFEYVQNLIVRPLTYTAPSYAAFIEESFPMEAMHDDAVFHDAVGDPEKYERNRQKLFESTFTFVDEGYFDLIPVGQYIFK